MSEQAGPVCGSHESRDALTRPRNWERFETPPTEPDGFQETGSEESGADTCVIRSLQLPAVDPLTSQPA
jgi:hypothetical protein